LTATGRPPERAHGPATGHPTYNLVAPTPSPATALPRCHRPGV